ncbi:ATP-binding protein [Jannaschia rubra]|uniref:histidine kinase n=1 Tax=Jannaschia rubra TaxID=282197 RepID=A0A0M6XS60_9RHOB|nr:ATP-binding protein [Jannaschia rubra]CTQ33467.1 Signal transduction histidine-protein kinase BarA [Jannaschia rubra]SFG02313.1 hypothetical protein SAMN04488517_102296 [Jannaschia rubra]
MDGAVPDAMYLDERRRRLAAERTLDHTRRELARAHSALVANADRLSRRYLAERDQNLSLTERQHALLAQRKEAADRADRARRRLWHALETMRDGFALFDVRGHLVAANSVYLDLFDATSEIGPGAHATEIFEMAADEGAFDIGDLSPAEWAAEQVARWDAPVIEPLVLHHYDGRVLRFQDRRAPDGDLVSLALDITEHRQRESSLTAARDTAEQTARAKAEFLARMSHEIRTPMNGVLGLSRMLVDRAEDAETVLYARTIRDSAEALLVIVNDTLDVSRIEAGRLDLRIAPLDLEALLTDCLRLAMASAAPDVQMAMDYPLGARTMFAGDAGRLRQIVMNLLGNALKFTDSGSVTVTVDVGEGEPAQVAIAVRDTGPGIPAESHETIFGVFEQMAEADRPAREGTGLGLTISRGLAQRMGGTLTIDSREGDGATFILSVPLPHAGTSDPDPFLPSRVALPEGGGAQAEMAAAALSAAGVDVARTVSTEEAVVILPLSLTPQAQSDVMERTGASTRLVLLGPIADAVPQVAERADAVVAVPFAGRELLAALAADDPLPAIRRPRLLLADDNGTNRLLLDRMLRDGAYDLDLVADGLQAVEAYGRHRPDAVVLDISMPGLDGFGAARAMRALDAEQGRNPVPMLALTAHAGEDMGARLRDTGFVAHLTKPVDKGDLLTALTAALDQASRTS